MIERWRAGTFQVIVSQHIIDEVGRGWAKPYWRNRIDLTQIDRALRLIRRKAEMTAITAHVEHVARHPEDDFVIATAISGNADYLVTGDLPFRSVERYRGITILTPREFLDLLDKEHS